MNGRRSFSTRFGGVALTNLIALILVYALFGNSLLEARAGISVKGGSSPEETTKKPTLQERILKVPNGMMIEVRLLNNQKLRGRMGDVTNEWFSLQTAQGGKIETQKVAITDVKSFKQVEGKTGKKIGTGLLIGLAVVGVIIIVGIAMCASGETCGG